MKILDKNLLVLDVKASTPDESIEKVGKFLLEQNLVTEKYASSLLNYFKADFNSFMFGDMVAIAQTDLFEEVLENALVLIRLEHSVDFGKISRRPIRLLFGLVATNSEIDMELHHHVVELIHNKNAFSAMLNEKTSESLYDVLKQYI